MKFDRWTNGTMREHLLHLKRGEQVVVCRATIKHRAQNLGATFWVMSVPNRVIYQVSEYAYGKNIYNLVSSGDEVRASKQDDCLKRAKGILTANNSVYIPKNRGKQTYLDIDSASLPERFRYDDSNATGT